MRASDFIKRKPSVTAFVGDSSLCEGSLLPLRRDGRFLLAPPGGIVGNAQEVIGGDMKIKGYFH